MKYIEKYGMKLSQIGMGTGRFGTRVSEALSYEMLDTFRDGGGNLIDTARNYYEWVENGRGKSEETIGRWMEDRACRKDFYISTKGGVRNDGRIFTANLSCSNLLEELQQSLEALRTKYVDIYLLHRDEPGRPVEEIVETLQRLKEAGNVTAIGVCNWEAERVQAANAYARQHQLCPIQIVQTWWSIAAYTPDMWNDPTTTHMDRDMYEYLQQEHMLAMAYTSQAKGFFQKAIRQGYETVDAFLKQRIATPENMHRLERIERYCKDNDASPTAVVNGYITDNPLDGIALVSCSRLEQLEDILCHCDQKIAPEFIQSMLVE